MDTQRTILVIDDNPLVREVVGQMLEHRGYAVLRADDPKQGLGLLAQHDVDAAIVDVDMPLMNGVEVCRALHKEASTLGRGLLVWLMTGVMRPDLVARAVAAGAMGVIPKPFTTDELIERMELGLAG